MHAPAENTPELSVRLRQEASAIWPENAQGADPFFSEFNRQVFVAAGLVLLRASTENPALEPAEIDVLRILKEVATNDPQWWESIITQESGSGENEPQPCDHIVRDYLAHPGTMQSVARADFRLALDKRSNALIAEPRS